MSDFVEDLAKFHTMYGLPQPTKPSTEHLPVAARMVDFKRIISEEVTEVDDITAKAGIDELDDLTDLADWLGDIIVYAASEMVRYGIPVMQTLSIIMQSNFSKLDADGNPIIVAGKVGKGPGYWKPEPKLKEMLERARK